MLQEEAGSAGIDPSGGTSAAGAGAGQSDARGARRHRYGRRRGPIPAGDAFVSRLGPAADEPFAALDDIDDGTRRGRPSPDTPIEDLLFVAIDCETTGQTPHRLVELGAVAFTLERHLLSMETLVHSNDRINSFARRVHGITSATLAGAPRAEQVMRRFRRFVHGSVLVEHSADAFDTRLLSRTLGEDLEADNLDTSRLAATLWGLRDTIGLERLCAELGVSHRGPHHALGDAEATAACFLALLERGRVDRGWGTLGDLLRDGQPPPPRVNEIPPVRRRRAAIAAEEAMAASGEAAQRRRRRRGGRRRGRRTELPSDVAAPAEPAAPQPPPTI